MEHRGSDGECWNWGWKGCREMLGAPWGKQGARGWAAVPWVQAGRSRQRGSVLPGTLHPRSVVIASHTTSAHGSGVWLPTHSLLKANQGPLESGEGDTPETRQKAGQRNGEGSRKRDGGTFWSKGRRAGEAAWERQGPRPTRGGSRLDGEIFLSMFGLPFRIL